MNIIEAYIKFKGQLIILISGLSGSGKTKLAHNLERDFKLTYVSLSKYIKKDYENIVKLQNNVSVIDWDNMNALDWERFNSDILEMKNEGKGIVISGFVFPKEKILFDVNFHLHVKISKKNLIEKRHKYIEENKKEKPELYELKDTTTESLLLNQITMPYYYDYLGKSKIDKYLNANEHSLDELYDECFDYLIKFIQEYLYSREKTNITNVTGEEPLISNPMIQQQEYMNNQALMQSQQVQNFQMKPQKPDPKELIKLVPFDLNEEEEEQFAEEFAENDDSNSNSDDDEEPEYIGSLPL